VEHQDPKEKKNPLSAYARYSFLAIQMGITIGLSAWFGQWIDQQIGPDSQIFTIVLSLIGVGASIYILISTVRKIQP
jgi:F0F1-type ATP synthase assembly protein I